MKANLILIALLLTVVTVTSCKENLVNDNSGDNLQKVENPFIGTWYDVYFDGFNDFTISKVIFTENHFTIYYGKERNENEYEYYVSSDYNNIEYFVLPDNKIQFNRNKEDYIFHDGTGKHITPYTFSGDTLIIKYVLPGTAAVVYPHYMYPIGLLKESK